MSDRGTDEELGREVSALIDALEDVRRELDPGDRRRRRLPTPGEFLRFTSEVTIPAAILVLETNVRVLKLLQRAIRMSTDGDAGRTPGASPVRDRAEALGRETLRQLDGVLDELQATVEGRPRSDEAADLLAEARRLQEEVEERLAAGERAVDPDREADASPASPVEIDVESELESLKDQIDDGTDDDGTDDDGG